MNRIAQGRCRGLAGAAAIGLALMAAAVPCAAQEMPGSPSPPTVDASGPRQIPLRLDPPDSDASKPVASDHQLLRKYVWSTLGLEGALHATLASGIDQWQTSPPEWGTDAPGYARRWASEYAESAIGDTAKYAVARLFHHDPSFTRCDCSGLAARLGHAVASPFMARTQDGSRVLSAASLTGMLAGHMVSSSTWYPAPLGARDGLRHAATSLISKIGVDIYKEFRPRRLKP